MDENYHSIKDYFIIGNLHCCALISKEGSIDWFCVPKFDSPSIFGRILDPEAGHFSVDNNNYKVSAKYEDDTAIVKFIFEGDDSSFEMKDFMIPHEDEKATNHFIIRKFKGINGTSNVKLNFNPLGDYGEVVPGVEVNDTQLKLELNGHRILLHIPEDAEVEKWDEKVVLSFPLKADETKEVILQHFDISNKPLLITKNFEEITRKFWKNWVETGEYFKYHNDVLVRSMITLKLLQYFPNGSLMAAATTSLPAEIGGIRNWDYRYTWIRDATFTLYAFHILDCEKEQHKFFNYLYDIMEKHSEENIKINTVYTIKGSKAPDENILRHLKGYKNSKPVRIGNNATNQFQMDVYGALIDAHYFMLKKKNENFKTNKEFILQIAEKIYNRWMEKDSGIWEMRGEQQHYTYSKVMCWVGLDRVIRLKDDLNLDQKTINKYKQKREEIKRWIWQNCFDEDKQTFEQFPGAGYQDATNYLFVLLQFLDKHDPKTKIILENTGKELCKDDLYVYRYIADDGLAGSDNAFLLCTFWMISAWAILEEVDKAEGLFERLLKKLAPNHLLSEQIIPETGEYTGNFPQAYSHLGITMTAYYIHKYKQRQKNESEEITNHSHNKQ